MTTSTVYRFRLPLPPKGTGMNARGHWSKRGTSYRRDCADLMRTCPLPDEPIAYARVTVSMAVCRRRPGKRSPGADVLAYHGAYRPLDRENFISAVKGAIDALQPYRSMTLSNGKVRELHGAGVIAVDDEEHADISWLPIVTVPSFAEEGVFITVEEMHGQ